MARTTTRSESRLDVSEASALARLPDGSFLVADDELGLVLAEAGGAARQLEPKSGEVLDDVEGLCLTSDGAAALVVSEAHGDAHRIPLVGRGDRLVTVGDVDLPLERGEKPEGVDVDPRGSLWVVCDGTGRLLELDLPG